MTIHVHKAIQNSFDAKFILVDPDRNVAVFVYDTEFAEFAKDLIVGAGWTVNHTVGEYICTLDELHNKYPELLI